MSGHDDTHLIGDEWGRVKNIDICSEAEPITTWPYMMWIQPSTQNIRVRNRADTGWITVGGGGGGGAPVDAQYLVLALNGILTAERVLTAGDGIALADGGAGGNATLSNTIVGAQYVTMALDGTLTAERVLTAGDGINITDGGAGGNVTIAADCAITDLSVFKATAQAAPNMTVSVDAGMGRIIGTVYEAAAQNSPVVVAPAANNRIAYLYAKRDTTATPDGITLFWVYGLTAVAPIEDFEPDVAGALLICKVYCRTAMTHIDDVDGGDGYILRDARPVLDQNRKWALFDEPSKIRTLRLPMGAPTKDAGNPILQGQGAGWEANVALGSVIQSPLDGIWYLYYSGAGAGSDIGVCTAPSPDGPWTRFAGNPVLSRGAGGAWDDDSVQIPSVIYDEIDGVFKMWYYGNDGANADCGLATCATPTGAWAKDAGNPIGLVNFMNSCSCIRIGNLYMMCFATTAHTIQVCDSADGTTFTNYQTIVSLGAGGTWDDQMVRYVALYFTQGTFYILYSGYDGANYRIGLASQAGRRGGTYIKEPRNPILDIGAGGSWDDEYVYNPGIVMHREIFHIWYTGWSGAAYAIGHATIP